MSSSIKLVITLRLIKLWTHFFWLMPSNNLLLNLLFILNRNVWIFVDNFLGWLLTDLIRCHTACILSYLSSKLRFRNNPSNLWRHNILKFVVDNVMGRRTEWLFLWILQRISHFIAEGKVQWSRLIDASDHDAAWCWSVHHWLINIGQLWYLSLGAYFSCVDVLRMLNLRI